MLKQNDWSTMSTWDSMHVKNISIIGNDTVLFKLKSILFNDLLRVVLSIIKISLETWSFEGSKMGGGVQKLFILGRIQKLGIEKFVKNLLR